MQVKVSFLHEDFFDVTATVHLGKTSAQGDDPDVVLDICALDQDGFECPTNKGMEEAAIEEARYERS